MNKIVRSGTRCDLDGNRFRGLLVEGRRRQRRTTTTTTTLGSS